MENINDLPDSHKNLIKKMRLSRFGNLDKLRNHGKNIIGQWIGGKTLGLRDLDIDKNNFSGSIDLSMHQIYNNVDVKISTFNDVYEQWRFDGIRYPYDNLLLLCADKYEPWKNIERVYIIPVSHINTLSITVRYLSKDRKYDIYKIDEKPFNETYHSVDIPYLFNPFDLWKGKYDVKKKDYNDIVRF